MSTKPKKVFLGGTCNNSKWRDDMKIYLDEVGLIYFDPVVDDWTEEDQKIEIEQRKSSDFCLYVITPKMLGVYSIAEAVDDSHLRPKKTVFVVMSTDEISFTEGQMKSLNQTKKLIERNGAAVFDGLKTAAHWMSVQ